MEDSLDANKWISRAQMDFNIALMAEACYSPIPIEIICYLCQQSVEKILKAYTIAIKKERTLTHSLKVLLDECILLLPEFDRFKDACVELTHYVTRGRYSAKEELIDADMNRAMDHTYNILTFTMSKLKELGYKNESQQPENVFTKEILAAIRYPKQEGQTPQ
jgi:HEPN domain-containing protein